MSYGAARARYADETAQTVSPARLLMMLYDRLAAQTGSDFGGAWLATDGTTLKVAVTDKAAEAAVRKAGAEPVLVERSEQALVTAKEKLDNADASANGLTGWYVDVATNKLVVVAQPGAQAAAKKLARAAGVGSAGTVSACCVAGVMLTAAGLWWSERLVRALRAAAAIVTIASNIWKSLGQ